MRPPLLSTVVVHWHAEDDVEALAREFPVEDSRFELVVVDNGSRRALALPARVVVDRPETNLGFAGGCNRGVSASRSPLLFFLNPDARIDRAGLEAILDAFHSHPEAAGIAPRMTDLAERPLHRWQLRRLPNGFDLLRMALWTEPGLGATVEPAAGTSIEQPAAAAWALRVDSFLAAGRFDESFFPAWFEDVDLARRLHDRGLVTLYAPAATVRHGVGSSVGELGFGGFLRIHDRSMLRYAEKHHGPRFARRLRLALILGTGLRIAALPLRLPQRARDRTEAATALRGRLDALRRLP